MKKEVEKEIPFCDVILVPMTRFEVIKNMKV
jgi:hypothetical protein